MDKRIKSFLERVEKQIYTEDESDLIKNELEDHIQCLVEDYEDAGLEKNHAVSKALLQMGDPREIGYSFADYDGMKKRKHIMLFFKLSAMFAMFSPFVLAFLNGDKGITSYFPMFISFGNVYMILTVGSLIHSHSMKFLELDTTPYLILWPTKERFKWEYFALFLFMVPMIILFLGLYFFEAGLKIISIVNLWPILAIIYGIWALTHSEKYRIPKYMVIDDGFIIKGRLVSWTSIKSYTWTKDFLSKSQDDYRLILTSYQREGQAPLKKTLNIHNRQHHYLQTILREKMS